jgi:hypothetical protein
MINNWQKRSPYSSLENGTEKHKKYTFLILEEELREIII